MAFEYERKEYQDNLARIKQIGTYQDYENAIFEMNTLKNDLKMELDNVPYVKEVATLIDQVDDIYYGDIAFLTDGLDEFQIYLTAGAICAVLRNQAEDCYDYSLYYNKVMKAFMYTKVVIQAKDGPDLYKQGTRKFVVR